VERWRQAGQRHRVALALRVLKGERQAARFAQREGGERRPQRLPGGDADREAPRRGVEERGHSVRRPSGHRIGAERLGTLTDGAVGVLDPDQEGVAGRSQRKGERQRLRRLGEEDVRRVVDPHHAGEDDVAAVLAAQRQHVIGLIRCARSARRAGSPGTRGALEEAPADLEAAPPEKRPADGLAENQEVGVAVVRDDGQRVVPLGMAEDEPRAARHPPLSAAAPDLPEPLPAHRQAELARSGLGLDPEDRRGRIGSVVDMEDSPILPEPGAPSPAAAATPGQTKAPTESSARVSGSPAPRGASASNTTRTGSPGRSRPKRSKPTLAVPSSPTSRTQKTGRSPMRALITRCGPPIPGSIRR
jgi:hypothetical protein